MVMGKLRGKRRNTTRTGVLLFTFVLYSHSCACAPFRSSSNFQEFIPRILAVEQRVGF